MSDYGRHEDTRTRDWNERDSRRDHESMFGGNDRNEHGWRGEQRQPSDRYGRSDWRQERNRSGSDRNRSRGEGREERQYGSDDYNDGLPVDETSRLIASNKVEGTAVYGGDGARLGSIYNFMVDKRSGRVEYAVMSYGGFLGMGTRYYPLPWRVLSYDTERRGYRIRMTERDLRDAPSFDRETEPRFDRRYGEQVHSWYGLPY